MNKLLILLGLAGAGAGVWWVVKKRQTPDGPSPMLPAGVGKGVLPGAGEIPAIGIDAHGNATIAPEPYVTPSTANTATDNQPVVVQPIRTAAEQSAYNLAHMEGCRSSLLTWLMHHDDFAGRAVQQCRRDGWLV